MNDVDEISREDISLLSTAITYDEYFIKDYFVEEQNDALIYPGINERR